MNEPIGVLRLEAETERVLLSRCQVCGHRHPLACQPPEPPDVCPGCGLPAAQPGKPHLSISVLPLPFAARLCLAVAGFFRRLERMIR